MHPLDTIQALTEQQAINATASYSRDLLERAVAVNEEIVERARAFRDTGDPTPRQRERLTQLTDGANRLFRQIRAMAPAITTDLPLGGMQQRIRDAQQALDSATAATEQVWRDSLRTAGLEWIEDGGIPSSSRQAELLTQMAETASAIATLTDDSDLDAAQRRFDSVHAQWQQLHNRSVAARRNYDDSQRRATPLAHEVRRLQSAAALLT